MAPAGLNDIAAGTVLLDHAVGSAVEVSGHVVDLVGLSPTLPRGWGFLLTALRLSRDDGVRFANRPSFVTSVFQSFIGDLRPKLF
jgi:hypothetical protein